MREILCLNQVIRLLYYLPMERMKHLEKELEKSVWEIIIDLQRKIRELEEENKKLKEENETLREELISRIRQPQNTPYWKWVAELMEEDTLQELRDLGKI